MQHIQCRWLAGITLAACLSSFCLTPDQSRALPLVLAQAGDEAALRALAEEFFAAYAKKDLESFIRLWSARSPDLESRKQAMQQLLANHEKIEVKNITVLKTTLDGENAKLRVEVEMSAVEAKTGKPVAGLGGTMRALHCAREGNEWRMWREMPAVEDLAERLVAAQTGHERTALLADEKELVTIELRKALITQGNRFRLQGRHPQALATYQLAQDIAERIGDKAGIAVTLLSIGEVYRNQGNHTRALESFQKSLTLSEALGDKAGIADSLNNIGTDHSDQGNYDQALEFFQKSLTLSNAVGDKEKITRTLGGIGIVHYSQGNYARAREYYQETLRTYEELGHKTGIAITLNNIGNTHNLQGNYAQALEHYQKGLKMFESLEHKAGIASALANLGNIHYFQGNYTQALEHYQKSLAMHEALDAKASIAITLNSLGSVHSSQGNYTQALEYYQRSLSLSETLGDKKGIALRLNNIGSVHYSQSNYVLALEYFQRSRTLTEALGDKIGTARALNNIGNVSKSQGNYAQALEHYQQSLALREVLGDKAGVASVLNNIGGVNESQGNYAQALEYYQRSLALREALQDKAGIAYTLKDIGKINRLQGNHAQAIDFTSRTAALAKQFGYPDALWRAQLTAGLAHRALDQLSAARQDFEESIATIETLRTQVTGGERDQQRSFEDKLAPFQAMVQLLISQNRTSEALAYAERARARVLLDVLHNGRVNITKAMTTQEQELEHRLNSQLVSLNTQISRESVRAQPSVSSLNDLKAQLQKARLDYEAFQTGLYAVHPALRTQRGDVQPLTLAQAGALLPDSQSGLLEFAVTDERTYLFVLTQTKSSNQASVELKVYSLEIERKDLADRVGRFRESLAMRDLGFRQSARDLYDLLLKPAQAQLQGKNSLVIVPDDALWELPFQALQPAPTRYLLEDYAISYTPSLTVLREMTRLRGKKALPTPGSSTLLAFGNPALGKQTIQRVKSVLMDEKLDPLPEAERQVNALRQIYGPAQSKIYIGSEAREETAKTEAGNYRILHLATHGILNDSSPMYSHVLLAQAESSASEDGLLEAWEILKLDLKADLAVLSACETARGRLGAGEGMIGLSWAFFVAGCPTTVVSQWKVESSSTTELMVEFHKQLRGRPEDGRAPTTKAGALRTAALKLLRGNRSEYRHPFYWAGFVMVGEGF